MRIRQSGENHNDFIIKNYVSKRQDECLVADFFTSRILNMEKNVFQKLQEKYLKKKKKSWVRPLPTHCTTRNVEEVILAKEI